MDVKLISIILFKLFLCWRIDDCLMFFVMIFFSIHCAAHSRQQYQTQAHSRRADFSIDFLVKYWSIYFVCRRRFFFFVIFVYPTIDMAHRQYRQTFTVAILQRLFDMVARMELTFCCVFVFWYISTESTLAIHRLTDWLYGKWCWIHVFRTYIHHRVQVYARKMVCAGVMAV